MIFSFIMDLLLAWQFDKETVAPQEFYGGNKISYLLISLYMAEEVNGERL